jgi:hypothetical protein
MVDGGKINPFFVLLVDQLPTLAAGGIGCATDIWEAGDLLEGLVLREELVCATNRFGGGLPIVILGVGRDFIGGKEGLLDVVIREVVQILGRGRIATCGLGAGDVREEDCEDECSELEIDHGETQGCRRSLARG